MGIYITTEVALLMPRKRVGLSIHDCRANGHQDIYGNVGLDLLPPIQQYQSQPY